MATAAAETEKWRAAVPSLHAVARPEALARAITPGAVAMAEMSSISGTLPPLAENVNFIGCISSDTAPPVKAVTSKGPPESQTDCAWVLIAVRSKVKVAAERESRCGTRQPVPALLGG